MKGVLETRVEFQYGCRRVRLQSAPMLRGFRRFFALPLPDQAATIEALAVVTAVRFRFSLSSQPRLAHWLQPLIHRSSLEITTKPVGSRGSTDRVATAVRRASARVPGASCLIQAVAANLMLKSRGIASRIRIGVDKSEQALAAHAWLTVDDITVLGGADAAARFVELRRH